MDQPTTAYLFATLDDVGTVSRRTGHRERAQVTITNVAPAAATLTSVTLLDHGHVGAVDASSESIGAFATARHSAENDKDDQPAT